MLKNSKAKDLNEITEKILKSGLCVEMLCRFVYLRKILLWLIIEIMLLLFLCIKGVSKSECKNYRRISLLLRVPGKVFELWKSLRGDSLGNAM